MTIASDKAMSGPYLGNGVNKIFDYKFKIYDAGQLQVNKHGGDGGVTALDSGVHYTVTGVGNDNGGTVVLSTALEMGKQLTIIRNMAFTQEMDLENQGAFYAEVIERSADEAVMRAQQLKEKLDRAITVPETITPADKDIMVAGMVKVADNIDNINAVAAIKTNVTTVAGVAGSVTTVAGVAGNVTTVAGVAGSVATVAGVAEQSVSPELFEVLR